MEDKGLLHTNGMLLALVTLRLDDPILASSLPVPSLGGPVGPDTVGVLAVLGREEEPLGIIRPDQRLICINTKSITSSVSRIKNWNNLSPGVLARLDTRINRMNRRSAGILFRRIAPNQIASWKGGTRY